MWEIQEEKETKERKEKAPKQVKQVQYHKPAGNNVWKSDISTDNGKIKVNGTRIIAHS